MRRAQVRWNPETDLFEPIDGSKPLTEILRPLAQAGPRPLNDFKLWMIAQRAGGRDGSP